MAAALRRHGERTVTGNHGARGGRVVATKIILFCHLR